MSDKSRNYFLFLEDMLNAIGKIEQYSKGLTLEQLKDNEMAVDAIIRNLKSSGKQQKMSQKK